MKKRLLLALLLIVAVAMTCFVFAGCKDKDETSHTHTYADEYTCHNRSCSDCGEILQATTNHDFTYGDCPCGELNPCVHNYTNQYTCHERVCTECGAICKPKTSHNFVDYVCACGEVRPSEGLSYELSTDGKYYVVSGRGSFNGTKLGIPSTYNGKPVKEIKKDAFKNDKNLLKVSIPFGVTEIGESAFAGCSYLTGVKIPHGANIGVSAFMLCANLLLVDIPYGTTSIGDLAFNLCTSLMNVSISSTVEEIGSWAFDNCNTLQVINVDEKNERFTSVDGNLYDKDIKTLIQYSTGKFDETFNLPNTVEKIESHAVQYAKWLKKVVLNSMVEVGASAFNGCEKLEEVQNGALMTSVGMTAFKDCVKLKEINIASAQSDVGFKALENCNAIEELAIYDSSKIGYVFGSTNYEEQYLYVPVKLKTLIVFDTSINDYAFYGLTFVKDMHLSENLASIGKYAFSDCSSLTSITVDTNNQYYKSIEGNLYNKDGTTLIQYAIGKTDTSFAIPNSVTSIGSQAFEDCSSLTYNEYDNAYYLGNESNKYLALIKAKNTSITSCTIHSNTKVIADSAFSGCSKLTSITIPNSVTSIGIWAFYGCSSLTEITIPNSVTSIGYEAFSWCSAEIKWGDNPTITTIGEYAFSGYIGTSITIPNSVTSIGSYAFWGCSSLTNVTIGNSVTSIGNSAFEHCTSLTSITFADTSTWYMTGSESDCENKTGGTAMDVTISTTNDDYFKSTYYNYYWYKK